jgi:hypothetical protein
VRPLSALRHSRQLWPINHEGARAMDALIVDKAIRGLSAFVSHTTELQVICG